MDIKDKVAIVTGASKGIGRSIALTLAKEGANVAVIARGETLLKKLANEITDLGVQALPIVGDMRNEEDIKNLVKQTVEKFNRLDILVNNAGIGKFHNVADMTTHAWDEMFNLNTRGLFIATRESLPHLRKAKESVVVNISSLAGKNSFKTGSGYSATKHAVMAFSRCLMLEERENGLRVLAMCPGSVETSFSDTQEGITESRKKRKMQPQDIADSVLHMLKMPQRTMVSEIDIRPSNP